MKVNLSQLRELAENQSAQIKEPCIVLLEGSLGAGKTQFVKYLLSSWKVQEVSSPTFSIINSYACGDGRRVYHVDLYRVENEADLESTGFWDLFHEPSIVLIEWADLINEEFLPKDWRKIRIQFAVVSPEIREVRIENI